MSSEMLGPRLPEYPYKLTRETVVQPTGQPDGPIVIHGWRVEYKRQQGGWRHFILVLDGAPMPGAVLDACRLVEAQ